MARFKMFIHSARVERYRRVEGKGIQSRYEVVAENMPCLCLPASEQDNLWSSFVVGEDYSVHFPSGSDVRKGDRLTVSTGVELLVSGVADYRGVPRVGHLSAACSTRGVR